MMIQCRFMKRHVKFLISWAKICFSRSNVILGISHCNQYWSDEIIWGKTVALKESYVLFYKPIYFTYIHCLRDSNQHLGKYIRCALAKHNCNTSVRYYTVHHANETFFNDRERERERERERDSMNMNTSIWSTQRQQISVISVKQKQWLV